MSKTIIYKLQYDWHLESYGYFEIGKNCIEIKHLTGRGYLNVYRVDFSDGEYLLLYNPSIVYFKQVKKDKDV